MLAVKAEAVSCFFCYVRTIECPGAALRQLRVPPLAFRQHYTVNKYLEKRFLTFVLIQNHPCRDASTCNLLVI